jgi:hypothetical protein
MGETIKIDINKLNSAISKLDTLAESIDTQRRSATSNCPIALPSLADGTLGATSKFLTEQKPELQTRLDLAKLLDRDGDGQASYSVDHGDQLWEVKRALSTELTNQLKHLDIRSKEDRERATLLAQMLNRYQNDPDIPWQVMNALGPQGLTTVMNKLRNLTGQYGTTYWQNTGDAGAEHQALIALQESMGKGLSGMFSSASTYMDSKWGKEVAQDPWAATVLLRYIDKANRDIDPTVFEAMGTELKDREHNDPMIWSQIFGPDYNHFGDQTWKNVSPLREYLNVADNSTRDAQAVMGNEDLLKYFTSERQDYDHLSDQAGKVLGVATVDAATSDNYQYAMKAADISSHLLWQLGDKDTKPLDGIKEEVGGIIATYIQDADRVYDDSLDAKPGSHLWGDENGHPYGYGISADSKLPTYGINLTGDLLRDVLEDVGDNDAAKGAIGKATTLLNAARFDYAAKQQGHDPDAMATAAHEASALHGYMVDGLANGNIQHEEDAAAERTKVAEFFTAPLDLIPTDKVPVIGDLVIGEAKDAIVEGYTADKTPDAVSAANADKGVSIHSLKLEALYAMSKNHVPTGVDWPNGNDGKPVGIEQLSDEQKQLILEKADTQTGVTGQTTREIDTSWDNFHKDHGRK